MKEPEKAKAGSGEPKPMEAAGLSEDGQPVQAAVKVRLGKVKDQSGKTNAGTEASEARNGNTEVKAACKRKAASRTIQ